MLYVHPDLRTLEINTNGTIINHPIISNGEDMDDEYLTERIARAIDTECQRLRDANSATAIPSTYDINPRDIYSRLLPFCPMVCNHCNQPIESCTYTSTVYEYGSVSLGILGADDYNHSDSDTQETSFECDECQNTIHPEELPIYIPANGLTLLQSFLTRLNNGDLGEVSYQLPNQPAQTSTQRTWSPAPGIRYGFNINNTNTAQVSATDLIGTSVIGNSTIATEDIIKEDIFTD